MKTSPCNVYPLTPHFYIVKLGFTEAVLTNTHNLYFEQKYEKYHNFSYKNCNFYSREKIIVYCIGVFS